MGKIEESEPANGRALGEGDVPINVADRIESSLGGHGMDVVADTETWEPAEGFCYCALHCIAETVIDSYDVDSSAPITGTLAGVTFSAGTVLYGKFVELTLTSGAVLAYLGVRE